MNSGGLTKSKYDRCSYERDLYESTRPLDYQMSPFKFENCSKCQVDGNFWRPFDKDVVDIESDLKGINRFYSRCAQFKYNKDCKKSPTCTSTFEQNVPRIADRNVCPIVSSGLPKSYDKGYSLETEPFCKVYTPLSN